MASFNWRRYGGSVWQLQFDLIARYHRLPPAKLAMHEYIKVNFGLILQTQEVTRKTKKVGKYYTRVSDPDLSNTAVSIREL